MFYCIIDDTGVGIFNDVERVLPYIEKGMQPFKHTEFSEIEAYIRSNLSFDRLFDLGWEIGIDIGYLNHFHTPENEQINLRNFPREPVPRHTFWM